MYHHLQRFKSLPSSTQITSLSKKKQRIKVCMSGFHDFFHFICQNTGNCMIALKISLYSLFFSTS